jgi:acetoin utilization deacetylase AcuC-like enzyme
MSEKKNNKQNQKKSNHNTSTGLIFHPDYLKHDSGENHPESRERLAFLMEYLGKKGILTRLQNIDPYPASVFDLELVHDPAYIKTVEKICRNGGGMLDPDTRVGEESYKVALLAAGGVMAAVDEVMNQRVKNAFCAVRPPGHHAEKDKAMGFCIFNNVAVGSRYVQKHYGLKKIFIVDWDVHHGNGTQNIFWSDPSVFYFSIHQYPHYPGTGGENETGGGEGEGFTFNMPMCAGSGELEYIEVFENILYPMAFKYAPDFIFISAGFDAHEEDPLAQINLTEAGYKRMTEVILKLASECCDGRLVSVLEGGYNLTSLSVSVEKHILALVGRNRKTQEASKS